MLHSFLVLFDSEIVHQILHAGGQTAPFWIPLVLALTWFELWLDYKQRTWIKEQGSVLLEIRLPREMPKSPVAMELFLNTLHNATVGNLLDVYLKGQVRTWYSLELASISGAVHFYIWAHKNMKNRIETQLYAQFPGIEVYEVPDYTLSVHRDPSKIKFGWFGQFALTKPDAYPIKTYVDYGLDKDPEEEFKNDPLVSVLEYLGSLHRGEQAWIQILIRAHAKEGLDLGRITPKPDWTADVEKEIKKILSEAKLKVEDDKLPSGQHLSTGQKDTIEAIERTTGKRAFDTMIRATYFAENEAHDPSNIGGLIGSILQFGSPSLNGFKPGFSSGFKYGWQDFRGKKKAENEQKLLEAYKRRSFFNAPYKNLGGKPPFILTTEELATLWHFPGATAATPTLTRIPSKKAEAPANLPI